MKHDPKMMGDGAALLAATNPALFGLLVEMQALAALMPAATAVGTDAAAERDKQAEEAFDNMPV